MKSGYFNDAPIITPEDDQFGIDPFARALAHSFANMNSPIGVTIAINGPWGAGKSSAVNLVRHYLKPDVDNGQIEIIEFKCWWFRGEEALTLAFLQELNASLKKTLGDKAKELIPRLGKRLLQAGPVVGPAINLATAGIWGTLTAGSMDFAKKFFPEGDSIEKLFQRLSAALQDQSKRLLVVIDDIDRLAPNEALLVFRLVKSVGRLPNVMYLLVFDRELAEKAVSEVYPSEGPHFLEKIIQASFELPLPARDELNKAVMSQIEAFCGAPNEPQQIQRFLNVFYDAISPYVNTPRDLSRLSNAMAVSWPAVAGEVDVGDFVALEVMRLFEPTLYNLVRGSKAKLCGVKSNTNARDDPKSELDHFLEILPERRQAHAKNTLVRLFPRFENISYSGNSIDAWDAQRRVCIDKHFDTYFRMSIGDGTLSVSKIEEFVLHAGDSDYVKRTFRSALGTIRKNGKSKVPLLLDELNVHASKIKREDVPGLICALFEIADEIYRKEDSERGFSLGDNHLRIHWFIRQLTFERCDLGERSEMFLAACRNAQVGWLTDFTSSAVHDHFPREGKDRAPAERCLIAEDRVADLKALALRKIELDATGELLKHHPQLLFILYQWGEFAADGGLRVKKWTSEMLSSDSDVSILAKRCTGETWSYGMGMFGLGDRVAVRNIKASIDGLDRIIDVDKFRRRLEEMEKASTLDPNQMECIKVFLGAWRRQEAGIER